MARFKKIVFWLVITALAVGSIAALPEPRRLLSESFTDWIRIYGDNPYIYMDRENDTGVFYGVTWWRNYDNSVEFIAGGYGVDEDYLYWLVRGPPNGQTLAIAVDGNSNVGIKTAPAAGIELDVNGDIAADNVDAGNVSSTDDMGVLGNLTVGGTAQFDNQVGIGTAPHATYELDVGGEARANTIIIDDSYARITFKDSGNNMGAIETRPEYLGTGDPPAIVFYSPYTTTTLHQRAVIVAADGYQASGNARGEGATDFGLRDSAAKVASGDYSVIAGGVNNTASGDYSAVPGGQGNTASADYSTAMGRNATAQHYGAVTMCSGNAEQTFATSWANNISLTASWQEVSLDGSGSANHFTIADDCGVIVHMQVLLVSEDWEGHSGSYIIEAVAVQQSGTPSILYQNVTVIHEHDISWDVQLAVNDVAGAGELVLEVKDTDAEDDVNVLASWRVLEGCEN